MNVKHVRLLCLLHHCTIIEAVISAPFESEFKNTIVTATEHLTALHSNRGCSSNEKLPQISS